jgi:outer membrane cobalamin receptor
MRAMYRLSESISLQARGENLLNQKYEINAGYPMPGATVMLGINIEF